LYAPGDDSEELARCDVRMLLEATRRALEVLNPEKPADDRDRVDDPVEAVTALLGVFHLVLRGLYGDVRLAAHDARELARAVDGLHGPVS
ncbi:hypothetical protein ACFL51_01650, partial [Myxococcota bacterium]